MIREAAGRHDTAVIEWIEREAWLDWFAAVPRGVAERLGVRSARIGAAALFAVREAPLVTVNRALGLGIAQPATEAALDQATAWLQQHGNPAWGLQIAPEAGPEALPHWLGQRHLTRAGAGWAKFGRGPWHVPENPLGTDVTVRPVDHGDATAFGAVVQAGFDMPPPFAAWFAALVGRPGWTTYLAYDRDIPVAGGAIYVDGGWGWLGMDATLRAHRGRGAQSALVARRVADGIAAGVVGFSAETAQPLPGQEAGYPSYRNFRRAGFIAAYARANYRIA